MAFLEIPGLPEKQVSLCAVSSRFPPIAEALAGEGIEVLTVPPLPFLPAPVASHADLQLMPLGGNCVLAAEEAAEPSKQLRQKGYEVVINDLPLGDRYPQDISLNFLVVGKNGFRTQKAHVPYIKEYHPGKPLAFPPQPARDTPDVQSVW